MRQSAETVRPYTLSDRPPRRRADCLHETTNPTPVRLPTVMTRDTRAASVGVLVPVLDLIALRYPYSAQYCIDQAHE